MYLLERRLCEQHAIGTQCFQGFLTWNRYHSPILLNMEAHILIHRFAKRAGIESHFDISYLQVVRELSWRCYRFASSKNPFRLIAPGLIVSFTNLEKASLLIR